MSEESTDESVRLDAWLWSVRVFKTRPLAAQACKKGQVEIAGVAVKPGRKLRVDDIIRVERRWITLTLRVKKLLSRRVGAKLVSEYCEDLTPPEEVEIAHERSRQHREGGIILEVQGGGRPTKKDRRELDELEERARWWDQDPEDDED